MSLEDDYPVTMEMILNGNAAYSDRIEAGDDQSVALVYTYRVMRAIECDNAAASNRAQCIEWSLKHGLRWQEAAQIADFIATGSLPNGGL